MELLGIHWYLNGNNCKHPFPQVPNAGDEIGNLWSLFSLHAESEGVQMRTGVDSLLCDLEWLGISWDLIEKIWNIPFNSLKPLYSQKIPVGTIHCRHLKIFLSKKCSKKS